MGGVRNDWFGRSSGYGEKVWIRNGVLVDQELNFI
jgi:hypothetical protein